MNKIIKKIKKDVHSTKTNVAVYFSTNKLFLSYIVLSLICTFLLRYFTVGITFMIKPLAIDLAIIIILGAFGYFIKPKKQFIYFFSILFIITIICLINDIYYIFYNSYASVGLLSTLGQAGEVGDSITDKLKISSFVFLLAPIIFTIINRLLSRTNYFNYVSKTEKSRRMVTSTLLAGALLIGIVAVNLTGSEYSQIGKQWNREYIVERFGIMLYQCNDLVQSVTPKISSLFGYDEAARNFREYYSNKDYSTTKNKYTKIFKNKNVVFVHMESIQSFLLDLKINGIEVTPNLNELKNNSLFFSKFYPQVSVGNSSDTEFTLGTSLMPALSGTVFVSYADRTYNSIYKELKEKDYYIFSMHANKAGMWNRAIMHTNLGFDTFYSKSSYLIPNDKTDPDLIGLGLSDKSFFKQSIPMLEEIEKENVNYAGYVISLSNHSPFSDLDKYGEFDLTATVNRVVDESTGETELVEDKYLENSKLGRYLKSARYADEALGEFIQMIEDSDYFDNTVFVLFGDHDAKFSRSEINYLYNYNLETGELRDEEDPLYYDYNEYEHLLNKNTPLLIWSKDEKYVNTYNYPMGMIDIFPTLSNMMGLTCEYCLGNDIFKIKNSNTVIFPNGNFLTNKLYYNSTKDYIYLIDKEFVVDEDYIFERKTLTDELLKISNDIIVHNLIELEGSKIGEEE